MCYYWVILVLNMRLCKPNRDLHKLLVASQCRKYAGSDVRPTLARYMDPSMHRLIIVCVSKVNLEKAY